jgi:hypothetical protein
MSTGRSEATNLRLSVNRHSSYLSFYESALAGCYICFATWKYILFSYFGYTNNEGISRIGKEFVIFPAIQEQFLSYKMFSQMVRAAEKSAEEGVKRPSGNWNSLILEWEFSKVVH